MFASRPVVPKHPIYTYVPKRRPVGRRELSFEKASQSLRGGRTACRPSGRVSPLRGALEERAGAGHFAAHAEIL
jgi:hypothetical protein